MSLVFLPQPKKMRLGAACLALPKRPAIGISSTRLVNIAESLTLAIGRKCDIAVTAPGISDDITLAIDSARRPQGYRLSISPRGIRISGHDIAGVRHGAATLEQVIQQSGSDRLPALEIEDWPDLPMRGVYYDVCRGRVPLLERLFELADGMAACKLNELQLYIEHTFIFRRHPLIGQGAGSLSAEDIMRLDRHCIERGIELVPSLASFGHMHTMLRHKPYHGLAEDFGCLKYHPEALKEKPGLAAGAIAQSLAPANQKVYDFLDSLFGEFLPCFTSDKFNVCCDETWDLGCGQSHELAKKIGHGKLYLGHIKKLNTIARKYGKSIQFWGDIIRHYPELIKEIPKDVTVLDWAYHSGDAFDRLADFTKTGLQTHVCPSVCSYVTLYPRVPESCDNIANWARSAVRHGAHGMLNTDWGDGGHYNFMEYSWLGYLFGAEQSWNHKADRKTFTARFCKLFLNIGDAAFRRALDELGEISQLGVEKRYQSAWQHLFFAKPDDELFSRARTQASFIEKGRITRRDIPWNAALGRRTIKRLEAIRKVFARQAGRRGADPRGILPYYIFAVDATIHAARKLAVLGRGGKNTAAERKQLVKEMSALMKRFEKLWMARSRRSEIEITLGRYRAAIKALKA